MKKRLNPYDVYGRLETEKRKAVLAQSVNNDVGDKSLEEQEEQVRCERLEFERQKLEADKVRAKSQALSDLGKGLNSAGNGLIGCGCALPIIAIGIFALLAALGLLK